MSDFRDLDKPVSADMLKDISDLTAQFVGEVLAYTDWDAARVTEAAEQCRQSYFLIDAPDGWKIAAMLRPILLELLFAMDVAIDARKRKP